MPLENIFKQHDLRLTTPRKQVFEALRRSKIPLTVSGIAKLCPKANRTSVYRTLTMFDELNIINVVHIGWKNYYELAEPFLPHHHHLYCVRCKNADPMQIPELESLIDAIATRHGFTVTDHHFELEGICQRCQKTNRQ